MADYFPGEIHIGGPIPKTLLERFIKAIVAEGVTVEGYGGPEASDTLLREALKEGTILDLYDDRARYGLFEQLESFLVKHRIHFDRHSDASCEFDAENVCYRANRGPITMLAGQNGDALVRCQEVLEILNGRASDQAKLKAVRKLVAPPQVTLLTPIHFT